MKAAADGNRDPVIVMPPICGWLLHAAGCTIQLVRPRVLMTLS